MTNRSMPWYVADQFDSKNAWDRFHGSARTTYEPCCEVTGTVHATTSSLYR